MPIFGWLVGIRNQALTQLAFGFVCMAISSRRQADRFPSSIHPQVLYPTILFLASHRATIVSEPFLWSPFPFHPTLRFTPGNIYTPHGPRPTVTTTVTCQ
jgi:hypothetical protein